jgi:hypothetical protein
MKISVRVLQVLGVSLRTGEGARYCGCYPALRVPLSP